MSDMEVGNQQEVVNNYDSIIRNNTGAYDKALTDMSMGKAPTVNGGGGEGFNLLTEAMVAKSGPAGGMFGAASEAGLFGGGSATENSSFFGGGGGKPRTKADVHRQRRFQMALTNSNPITGKLTRQQNLALWKDIRREMSGHAPKSKNPMSGGSGKSFTGEKEGSAREKMFPTKGDLNNPHVLRRFGLHKIAERIADAQRARVNRTLFEDLKGSDMGFQDAKESLKTQQKDEVRRVAETTMVDEKRDSVLQDVMAQEDFEKYKREEEERKAASGMASNEDENKRLETMTRRILPIGIGAGIYAMEGEGMFEGGHNAPEKPEEKTVKADAPAPPSSARTAFKAMAPPQPSWARPPNRFGEKDS